MLKDKNGNQYYTVEEALEQLGIKTPNTLRALVKRHQLKRYGFYPSKRVYYKKEDIDYLADEETKDVVELTPRIRGYRPERGPVEGVIIEEEQIAV